MIGLYLLTTVFIQLAPQIAWFSPQHFWIGTNFGPSYVVVNFPEPNNAIKIGGPVFAKGELIGTISRVINKSDSALTQITNKRPLNTDTASIAADFNELENSEVEGVFRVEVKIAPQYRNLLQRGAVSLVTSPLSSLGTTPQTMLEFLIPNNTVHGLLRDGELVAGYTSFEEFWAADLTKLGLKNNLFSIS